MEEKLTLFLQRIKLKEEYYSFFKNASLDKIIIHKNSPSKYWQYSKCGIL